MLRADFVEHQKDSLIGAAVQGAIQGRSSGRGGGERVDLRASDASHGAGAAVLLVIGVENKKDVERVFEDRVDLVLQLCHLEQHVEQVSGIAEIVIGID